MTIRISVLTFLLISLIFVVSLSAQKKSKEEILNLINTVKEDPRGPYKDIRWFCKDGSFREPRTTSCPTGGVQRARYKDEITALAKTNHLFFGQILSATKNEEVWDADNNHSRLKQYQLEKYLRAVDDGWVLRKGQFYRGAYQAEDEEAWGKDFFKWVLGSDTRVNENFFLLRQAAKDIPHSGADDRLQNIRNLSKVISDSYAPFMELRIKIHGQPEPADLEKVKAFRDKHLSKLSTSNKSRMDELIEDMELQYAPINLKSLEKYLRNLPAENALRKSIAEYISDYGSRDTDSELLMATAELLWQIRHEMLLGTKGLSRLALLDVSNELELILFREIGAWKTDTLEEILEKNCYLGMAAAGCGFVEEWEWEKISTRLSPPSATTVSLNELTGYAESSRALLEWGTGMVRAIYRDVVNQYIEFEPLAYGFFDDRIRASVLLPFGQNVSILGDVVTKESALSNKVMDIPDQSQIRGLNPGFALGELVVLTGEPEEVSKEKIYMFDQAPADLKPVAGIATVSEGNMVSHVQLLARNLAIPNAVITNGNLAGLKKYSGQKVFYAVSNRGTVIMKPESAMNTEEKKLFEVKKRSEERIKVPVDKIDLQQTRVLNLRNLKATDSGKLCGPKAANLGQLKLLFPENVVEGIVIPFGIFRSHMDQAMPGEESSYWEFLNAVFKEAANMRSQKSPEDAIEKFQLEKLAVLREAIKKMTFQAEFVSDLKSAFKSALGKEMGEVPVFLRSDTNMEDLKDFTGAGLNLTLFNVLESEKIIQGIKDVWASPYTERSFKWRQQYLLNPENVFPSILIIPSVDVDYSGVLITKGITNGNPNDLTVAISLGAGGAVDGQAAETFLLKANGENILLAPAREPGYRKLPASGGTQTLNAAYNQGLLNESNLFAIRQLAMQVYQKIEKPGGHGSGPFDIEFGFKDNHLWLFQIRPFVENKNAKSSEYLDSISPVVDGKKEIPLKSEIQ